MANESPALNSVELAVELTIAWLGNTNTRASSDEVTTFLNGAHKAVLALGNSSAEPVSEAPSFEYTPATTARRSLASKDHIISLIDGKPYKTLRRHLSKHGLTPDQYRDRYKLKGDYPMVAPSYSETRRSLAKKIGLGRKSRNAAAAPSPSSAKSKGPGRRGTKAKSAAPK